MVEIYQYLVLGFPTSNIYDACRLTLCFREGSVSDEAHEEAGEPGGGHPGAVEDDAAERTGSGRVEASHHGTRLHRATRTTGTGGKDTCMIILLTKKKKKKWRLSRDKDNIDDCYLCTRLIQVDVYSVRHRSRLTLWSPVYCEQSALGACTDIEEAQNGRDWSY